MVTTEISEGLESFMSLGVYVKPLVLKGCQLFITTLIFLKLWVFSFFFFPSILARTRLFKHPRDESGVQLPSSSSSSLTLLCVHTARPGDSKSLEKYKLAHRSGK